MRWLTALGRRLDEPSTEAAKVISEEHRSLALKSLCDRLHSNQNYSILDLGCASSENLSFFSQFSKKIHIGDLYRTLASFDYLSPEDGISLDVVFRYLLPFDRGAKFDLLFGWDLVNYLDPKQVEHLLRHLARHSRKGALLFLMISTKKKMPEEPRDYRVVDPQTLSYRNSSRIMSRSPRYQETDLRKMSGDFRVANSFLLRNGIKEYLLSNK